RARDAAKAKGASAAEIAQAADQMVRYLDERKPLWSSFHEHRKGRFVVRVTDRDAILVPYALQAIEAASDALEKDLGFRSDEPVVVELYPNRRSFIAASTLSREEVETSGTLAI